MGKEYPLIVKIGDANTGKSLSSILISEYLRKIFNVRVEETKHLKVGGKALKTATVYSVQKYITENGEVIEIEEGSHFKDRILKYKDLKPKVEKIIKIIENQKISIPTKSIKKILEKLSYLEEFHNIIESSNYVLFYIDVPKILGYKALSEISNIDILDYLGWDLTKKDLKRNVIIVVTYTDRNPEQFSLKEMPNGAKIESILLKSTSENIDLENAKQILKDYNQESLIKILEDLEETNDIQKLSNLLETVKKKSEEIYERLEEILEKETIKVYNYDLKNYVNYSIVSFLNYMGNSLKKGQKRDDTGGMGDAIKSSIEFLLNSPGVSLNKVYQNTKRLLGSLIENFLNWIASSHDEHILYWIQVILEFEENSGHKIRSLLDILYASKVVESAIKNKIYILSSRRYFAIPDVYVSKPILEVLTTLKENIESRGYGQVIGIVPISNVREKVPEHIKEITDRSLRELTKSIVNAIKDGLIRKVPLEFSRGVLRKQKIEIEQIDEYLKELEKFKNDNENIEERVKNSIYSGGGLTEEELEEFEELASSSESEKK